MSAVERAMVAAAFGGLIALSGVVIAADQPAPARRLRSPEHVTSTTQTEISRRMAQHGETMANLVRAVVLLDRPTIRVLAGRIADEEVVAHASKSPHEPVPLSLPREFFLQQTRLAVAARDLAAAVVQGADDGALGERFAAVTSTCIACHSAYLHGQPEEPAAPRPERTKETPGEVRRRSRLWLFAGSDRDPLGRRGGGLRNDDRQLAVLELRVDVLTIRLIGQSEGPGEAAIRALVRVEGLAFVLLLCLTLARDREPITRHAHLDVLFLDSGNT